MKNVRFTLDGEPMEAAPGTTILSAAERRGIFIPTFCHSSNLKPLASCYVCVVDVEGEKDLVPSCSTHVADGMVIRTSTDRVKAARRTCIELLLSDHLGDCIGPCMAACPAGIDIPGFIKHLAQGENSKAYDLILSDMPFPGSLGRICHRPCEDACRRQLVEEPVAVCHLKRFVADAVAAEGSDIPPEKAPATGKKIAIVGAGPAGLAAAYYLLIMGHACSIFDAHKRPGGMLRYGIPRFRLPETVIDREVKQIASLGATFHCSTCLGEDILLDDLRSSFDAVFIGTGAWKSLRTNVEGEKTEGVLPALTFLRNPIDEKNISTGSRVIVIGGGGVAVDAARTARRKGAGDVHIYCLEKKNEMPATKFELDAAAAEGIILHNRLGVKRILTEAGRITGVEFKRCTAVFDEQGGFNPLFDESDISAEECETLIVAAGQCPDLSFLDTNSHRPLLISLGPFSLLNAHEHTMQTPFKDVFAGGDCVTGAGTAVDAVAAGRKAAISIDQFINGMPVVGGPVAYCHSMGTPDEVPKSVVENFSKAPRIPIPELDPKTRVHHFEEVETGLSHDAALSEAKRCMECGCRSAADCRLRSYAAMLGADGSIYNGSRREYNRDESHPEILYDEHKCIKCRTCVRIAEEFLGTDLMQASGRGFVMRIGPARGTMQSLVHKTGLSMMVENCPVGALTFKNAPVATATPVKRRQGVK